MRSPAAAIATTTPVRPPIGPATSTPREASSAPTSAPAESSPRFVTSRADAPSDTAHAATFAACPPAVTRVVATRSSSGASGSSRLAITSRSRSPSVVICTVRWLHGRPGPAALVAHAPPLVRARGLVGAAGTIAAARRLGRSRRPRDAPAGLAAFEDAPCFLELVEREAQRYREGGGEMETGRSKPE